MRCYRKRFTDSWEKARENAVQIEFRKELDKLLESEWGFRKFKMFNEIAKRLHALPTSKSLTSCIDNYKKITFSEDVSD